MLFFIVQLTECQIICFLEALVDVLSSWIRDLTTSESSIGANRGYLQAWLSLSTAQ